MTTSLAVNINSYNNISSATTTPREKKQNPLKNSEIINNNLNNRINNHSPTSNTYALKTTETYGLNGNSLMESSQNNVSANYALINRIKVFESQKKLLTNSSNNSNYKKTAFNNNNNNNLEQTSNNISLSPVNGILNNTFTNNNKTNNNNINNGPKLNLDNHLVLNDTSNNHTNILINNSFINSRNLVNNYNSNSHDLNEINNQMTNSPTFGSIERRSSMKQIQQKNTSKSQEDFYRNKLMKSANLNAYQDKITDQKFFNRNFKLKNDPSINSNSNNGSNVALNENAAYAQQNFNDENNNSEQTLAKYVVSKLNSTYQSREKNGSEISKHNYYQSNTLQNNSVNNNLNVNNQAISNSTAVIAANNQINKLKLLKKRNALKKTLSNAMFHTAVNSETNNNINSQHSSPSYRLPQQNYENLINSSKEDFSKSQNSLNKSSFMQRPLSMHLSRNSLNNIEQVAGSNTTNTTNNHNLIHKSSETIDELVLNEIKLRESANQLDRTKSASRLNIKNMYSSSNIYNGKNTPIAIQNGNQTAMRTKSENELHNLNDSVSYIKDDNNRMIKKSNHQKQGYDFGNQENLVNSNIIDQYSAYKSVNPNNSYINRMKAANNSQNRPVNSTPINKGTKSNDLINISTQKSTNNSRLHSNINTANRIVRNSATNIQENKIKDQKMDNDENDDDDYDNVVNSKDFRILFPGYSNNLRTATHHLYHGNNNQNELFLEPNPYNIMSDPIISEQFRRLYEEDEYFQQVHKKVSEWLNKYVFSTESSVNENQTVTK